jgi:hypothetical protein
VGRALKRRDRYRADDGGVFRNLGADIHQLKGGASGYRKNPKNGGLGLERERSARSSLWRDQGAAF